MFTYHKSIKTLSILILFVVCITFFSQKIYAIDKNQEYNQYYQLKQKIKIKEDEIRLINVQEIISLIKTYPSFRYLLLQHLSQESSFIIQQSILTYLQKNHQMENFTPIFQFIQNTKHIENIKIGVQILLVMHKKLFLEKTELELKHHTQYALICPILETLRDLKSPEVEWTQNIWKKFQLYNTWKKLPLSKEIQCVQFLPEQFFLLEAKTENESCFLYLHHLMYLAKNQHTQQLHNTTKFKHIPKNFFDFIEHLTIEKQDWIITYLFKKEKINLNDIVLKYQTNSILSWITRNFHMVYSKLTTNQISFILEYAYQHKKLTTLYSITQTFLLQKKLPQPLIRICREHLYQVKKITQAQGTLHHICIYAFLKFAKINPDYQKHQWKKDLAIIIKYLQETPPEISELTVFNLLESIVKTEICILYPCIETLLLSKKRNFRRKMWLLLPELQEKKYSILPDILYQFETDPLIYDSELEKNK